MLYTTVYEIYVMKYMLYRNKCLPRIALLKYLNSSFKLLLKVSFFCHKKNVPHSSLRE